MDRLSGIEKRNRDAVIREYVEARASGDDALAERIAAANPDVFPEPNGPSEAWRVFAVAWPAA